MKISRIKAIILSTVAAILAASVLGAGPTTNPSEKVLHPGDTAPPLSIGTWIKGEPVNKFEPGKTYVVEFWATWCVQCKKAIPHLTELQTKYSDMTFVGMDIWEREAGKAEPFVQRMGETMNYHVATDESQPHGKTSVAWMTGKPGIPTAFVVGPDGKIAWTGSPFEDLDNVLDAIHTGKFNVADLAALDSKRQDLLKRYKDLNSDKKYAEALVALDEYLAVAPFAAKPYNSQRLALLIQCEREDEAITLGRSMADDLKGNPDWLPLSQLSYRLGRPVDGKERTPPARAKLAVELAEKALDMQTKNDPAPNWNAAARMNLGHVYFWAGR